MPGGFVRVADDADARAVSLQRGGRTGDAWVLSDKPVAETTLLPAPDRITITRATGALPSRAADNLFWVGALCGACRGDAAAGARPGQPRHRQRRGRPRWWSRSICALLGDWDAVPTESAERQAGAGRLGRAAAARPRRRAAPSRRRGASGRLGDPRPVLSRRLAGADRSVRADQCADRPGRRPKPRSSSGSTARCASSRRSRAWRRKT